VIGAHRNDDGGTDAGKAYLILGRASADWTTDFALTGADASFMGSQDGGGIGYSLAGAGDVNRDGYDDFLIGAEGYDSSDVLTDSGRAYLVFGRPDGWDTDIDLDTAAASGDVLALDGEAAFDRASTGLSGDGDVNGDGFADVIVGSQWNDDNGDRAGKAYLLLGRGLVVDKSASAWALDPGDTITYTLSYNNTENLGVDDVRIGDRIPTGLAYLSCSGGVSCVRRGQRVFWYLGTIAAAATGALQMTAQVPSGTAQGTVITNSAWITAPGRLNTVFTTATTRVGYFDLYLPLVLR
jgi:uncharacterized repeat protein (TIGR01451 family)